MKTSTALVSLLSTAGLVCGPALAGDKQDKPKAQPEDQVFGVPFFVETPFNPPTTFGYRIQADLGIPNAAVLQSFSLDCSGTSVYAARLDIDPGAAFDYQGATVTTSDPNSGVAKTTVSLPLPITIAARGGSTFPLSRMHVPVKAMVSVIIFVEASKIGQCRGYAQFKRE